MVKAIKIDLDNNKVKSKISELALLKFDEKSEVLFKDIPNLSNSASTKINIIHNEIQQRSGKKLFPQIYIPKLDYDEKSNSRESQSTSTDIEPVFLFSLQVTLR